MVGLNPNPERVGLFMVTLMLTTLAAITLGLSVSAVSPNVDAANALVERKKWFFSYLLQMGLIFTPCITFSPPPSGPSAYDSLLVVWRLLYVR